MPKLPKKVAVVFESNGAMYLREITSTTLPLGRGEGSYQVREMQWSKKRLAKLQAWFSEARIQAERAPVARPTGIAQTTGET